MFLTIFLLSIGLVAIALLGLGIQTFFSRKRKFPETSVGHNKELRKRNIYCIKTQQVMLDKNYKLKSYEGPYCSSC